jgi:hypothetical protein
MNLATTVAPEIETKISALPPGITLTSTRETQGFTLSKDNERFGTKKLNLQSINLPQAHK